VADADIAGQAQHMTMTEYITDESVALALPQSVFAPGYDSSCILTAMLQDR
jgi:hypothetical protein